MASIFKELVEQGDNIYQMTESQDAEIGQACVAIKDNLFKNLDSIKSSVSSVVKNRNRALAKSMHFEVIDTRESVEKSIRSDYLKSNVEQSGARDALIVVAKKLKKIEKALCFADDMLFAGEISKDLGKIIEHAEEVIEQSKEAAKAMHHSKRLDHNHDRDLGMQYQGKMS